MRIDVLARRWGGPNGGPDGMAVAAAYLAWTLAELGHDVRAYREGHGEPPWQHARVTWRGCIGLWQPEDWSADLVISTISPTIRRLARAAQVACTIDRLVYWHHHGEVLAGLGCTVAAPPASIMPPGVPRSIVLPPSSWAADIGPDEARQWEARGSDEMGGDVLVPGAGPAKGGHVALQVAERSPDLSFYVLPGRCNEADLTGWRRLPRAEVAAGHVAPRAFLPRARAVLSPTRAEVHPLMLVEAAVRGIPIVCSDLPGTRAAAGDCAIYVPVTAPAEAWRAALDEALARPRRRLYLPPYADVVKAALAELSPSASRRPARPRPRVAILADVRTWAWARKSQQLQRHLSDEFEVEIAYLYDAKPDPIPKGADLYHTFEVFQASKLPHNHGLPYVTGMTAHVWQTWEERHGAGTVARWAADALAFHANSMLLVEEMTGLLRRPIAYVPNGVDESFFRRLRPRRTTSRLIVGFQGKPNPRKGGHLVEEACRLAGVELRANQRTHRDALGPDEMREFYQDLHVLCVASDMDGTPNSALEAAACGVAVVGNRIGNLPELLVHGNNGLLVERSAESIAAALRELAADLPRVERMGEAARASIEAGWTWRQQSENYRMLWRDALSARASTRRVA